MDWSSKQKINKETRVLNDTLDEMHLIDILGHSIQMQKNTSSQQVTEEIKKEVKKFLDTNENTTTQNL